MWKWPTGSGCFYDVVFIQMHLFSLIISGYSACIPRKIWVLTANTHEFHRDIQLRKY